MFTKILTANRGVRAEGAGVHSHLRAAHVMGTPNCLSVFAKQTASYFA